MRGLIIMGYGRPSRSVPSTGHVGGDGSPASVSISWHSHLSWQAAATSGDGSITRPPASATSGAAVASTTGSRSVSGSTAPMPSRATTSATAAP